MKVRYDRSVWMTHDPITRSIKQVEKNYTGGSFLMLKSKKQPDETYFPPQKIFVVITRLERLKNGEWKQICYNTWTCRITAKKKNSLQRALQTSAWERKAPTHHNHAFLPYSLNVTHTHTSISVTVPGLGQQQWMSECCRRKNPIELSKCQSRADEVGDKALEVHPLFSIFEEGQKCGHGTAARINLSSLYLTVPVHNAQPPQRCARTEMIHD